MWHFNLRLKYQLAKTNVDCRMVGNAKVYKSDCIKSLIVYLDCNINMKDHINIKVNSTPMLFQLHWLPVEKRITYKIPITVSKVIHYMTPAYLKDMNISPANKAK